MTYSAPITPEAPARLSTITVVPRLFAKFCAIIRPSLSVRPPGDHATTKVIVRLGYDSVLTCAAAGDVNWYRLRKVAIKPRQILIILVPSGCSDPRERCMPLRSGLGQRAAFPHAARVGGRSSRVLSANSAVSLCDLIFQTSPVLVRVNSQSVSATMTGSITGKTGTPSAA